MGITTNERARAIIGQHRGVHKNAGTVVARGRQEGDRVGIERVNNHFGKLGTNGVDEVYCQRPYPVYRVRATMMSIGGARKVRNRYTIVPAPIGIGSDMVKYQKGAEDF